MFSVLWVGIPMSYLTMPASPGKPFLILQTAPTGIKGELKQKNEINWNSTAKAQKTKLSLAFQPVKQVRST